MLGVGAAGFRNVQLVSILTMETTELAAITGTGVGAEEVGFSVTNVIASFAVSGKRHAIFDTPFNMYVLMDAQNWGSTAPLIAIPFRFCVAVGVAVCVIV